MNKTMTKGSAILEMALFVPLAAMLFFVGTDAALRATDQAALNDILRGSLTEYRKSLSAPSSDDETDTEIIALKVLLQGMESKIIANLWPYQSIINKRQQHDIKLAVAAIAIDIDPNSGIQSGVKQLIPCDSDVEACKLVEKHIQKHINSATGAFSSYAVVQSNNSENNTGLSYFSQTVLFVAALSTPSRSISPYLTQKMLGITMIAQAVQEIYVSSYTR
ncbi:MAG: hypothetical protein IT292_04365 [Deltaproteobacteria bacterium]|nr:hypothetical protein [Deltaproteobacteria bacterium]